MTDLAKRTWPEAEPPEPYLAISDTLNPTHRLWSDGRWNKITLAHGCYWKRCAFCDISLDYISRFEPTHIEHLLDHMEQAVAVTGVSGFHFVDEAAPPRLMRDLALGILRRGLPITWWGNIRFEPTFTPDLCRLLAASGLVAVTGGLEVASDRLLTLMDKGITVARATRTAAAFRMAGVQVHAYLMYGFPTQTDQESIDAMELVRQLFAHDLLSSAFWHRFVLTRHSGVFADPARYTVEVPPIPSGIFATNDLPHLDPTGGEHDRFDLPLAQSLAAWMAGDGLHEPLASWFDGTVPRTTLSPHSVEAELAGVDAPVKGAERLTWLGGQVLESPDGLVLHTLDDSLILGGTDAELSWTAELLDACTPSEDAPTHDEAKASFPGNGSSFRRLWRALHQAGLVGT
jgi:hypothetical protein